MKVVVIGNGPAGNSLASKLDKSNVEVELYSNESVGFYSRIKLPNCLGDLQKLDSLYSKNEPSYVNHKSVVAIHRDSKTLLLSDGESTHYDKLVIATGSNARRFFSDSKLEGIYTLRTYSDAKHLTQNLEGPVVVLGGGLLGMEAALAINNLGYEVSVVQLGDYVLSAQLNEEAAKIVRNKCCERDNFHIYCKLGVSKVSGEKRISSVELDDGKVVPCKTLLIAAGVVPSVSLAKACSLDVERAIVINSKCQTSDEDIYAIGDCAQYDGLCPGLMPIALTQAGVAAKHILGESIEYIPPQQMPVRFVADDMEVDCFGSIEGECFSKKVDDRYEAWFFDKNKVVGAILIGSKAHLSLAKNVLGKEVDDKSSLLDF